MGKGADFKPDAADLATVAALIPWLRAATAELCESPAVKRVKTLLLKSFVYIYI